MEDPELPEKFAYLNEVVRKYTFSSGLDREYEDLIERLEPEEVAEIAAVYERLAANPEEVRELSDWIRRVHDPKMETFDRWLDQERARAEGKPLPGEPMEEPETDWPRVYDLFFLFDFLKKQRWAPFKSGRVRFAERREPPLDWTKLPEGLRWLAGPAEKYWKRTDRYVFKRRINPEERAELREVVRRLWSSAAVLKEFQDWCAAHPATKHPETNRMNWLWELIVDVGEADRMPEGLEEELERLRRG